MVLLVLKLHSLSDRKVLQSVYVSGDRSLSCFRDKTSGADENRMVGQYGKLSGGRGRRGVRV